MMLGLRARMSSTSICKRLRAAGRKLVRNTSDVSARRYSSSSPPGVARSRPTLRFPRLGCSIMKLTEVGPLGTSPEVMRPRCGSPVSGCSTLITSAPQSQRTAPAEGTKVQEATSSTLTPSSTPLIIHLRSRHLADDAGGVTVLCDGDVREPGGSGRSLPRDLLPVERNATPNGEEAC